MGMYVEGVCVGRKDETVEYMNKEGKPDSFRSITATFADPAGSGDPVAVEMEEHQIKQLQAFHVYRLHVEARAVQTKRGIFCRISAPKGAIIEKLGPPAAAAKPAPGA